MYVYTQVFFPPLKHQHFSHMFSHGGNAFFAYISWFFLFGTNKSHFTLEVQGAESRSFRLVWQSLLTWISVVLCECSYGACPCSLPLGFLCCDTLGLTIAVHYRTHKLHAGKKNIQPVALCFKLILMTKKRKKHLSNFLVVHVLQSMHGVLAFWLNFGTPLGFKKSQKYRVTCWTSHFWLFLVCLLQPWCAQSALQHYKTPSFTPFSMSVGTCVYSCHNRREPGLPSS